MNLDEPDLSGDELAILEQQYLEAEAAMDEIPSSEQLEAKPMVPYNKLIKEQGV